MSTETVDTVPAEDVTSATPEAKAVKEPKVPSKCKCSLYSKVVGEGDSAVLDELIPCTATTNGNFAPGHDAKLKSQLIQLGAAGTSVYKNVDGEDVEMSAQDAANEYGFGPKVALGIERAKGLQADKDARAEATAKRKADAAAAKEAQKQEREAARAKKAEDAAAAKAAKVAAAEAAKNTAATPAEVNADANGSDDESLF